MPHTDSQERGGGGGASCSRQCFHLPQIELARPDKHSTRPGVVPSSYQSGTTWVLCGGSDSARKASEEANYWMDDSMGVRGFHRGHLDCNILNAPTNAAVDSPVATFSKQPRLTISIAADFNVGFGNIPPLHCGVQVACHPSSSQSSCCSQLAAVWYRPHQV